MCRLKIRVKGHDIANPITSFAAMDFPEALRPVLLNNIEQSMWKEPTPIQMQAIPVLLSRRDVIASAPTGSGYQ